MVMLTDRETKVGDVTGKNQSRRDEVGAGFSLTRSLAFSLSSTFSVSLTVVRRAQNFNLRFVTRSRNASA